MKIGTGNELPDACVYAASIGQALYLIAALPSSIPYFMDRRFFLVKLIFFLQTKGRKSRENKEFCISTSLTHFGALKAHGYWDEDSDLCLATPHLEVTFIATKLTIAL